MKSFSLVIALGIGLVLGGTVPAGAQFYGGYYGGLGYGAGLGYGGFGYGGGTSMGGFAPPHSIGGYYPVPYSTIFPGYVGNGYNPGYFGAGPMTLGPYGNGGYGYVGSNGVGGYDAYGRIIQPTPTLVPTPDFSSLATPTNQQVIHSGAPIKLVCPKAAAGSLTYTLNGKAFTIQPGYSQSFRDDRNWKLEFRRGDERSEVVGYTLKPGTFNFALGDNGWELRQVVNVPTGELPPAPQPAPIPASTPTPKANGPMANATSKAPLAE